MSMLNYYKGLYLKEEPLVDVYYSATFRVTAYTKVCHGYEVQARFKIESVSYDSEPTEDSFHIRYGEALYAILDIDTEDDGYENTEVTLFSEPITTEQFFEFNDVNLERYEYHQDCIPYCWIHDYMYNEDTKSISNMTDFHYSDFISINY